MLSAEEFIRLRQSERSGNYLRAATESAEIDGWLEIIYRFPNMRVWVAQNKTVPLEILSILARDEDPAVRAFVAMKNKLSMDLIALLARTAMTLCGKGSRITRTHQSRSFETS
jgi:hypothetical protein